MAKHEPADEAIQVFRGSDERVSSVLKQMEQDASVSAGHKRDNGRAEFRDMTCPIELVRKGEGGRTTQLVPTRNLSAGGVGFLHRSYLHVGTRFRIRLTDLSGQVHNVEGAVAWCRYVSAMVHEIGGEFDEPISLAKFCQAPAMRLAVQSEDEAFVTASCGEFSNFGIQTATAATAEDLAKLLQQREYDAVVCRDSDLDEQAVKTLKDAGFRGPVIAVGDAEDAEKNAHFDRVFGDPVTAATTADIIKHLEAA
ncbi:MAG: hypothetical protein DHS20C14_15600 [Phycisphaeraceae bacterium]|nr:MAG: hypothetical protein DHS20C14_15600 [Phycisphaeraceae bacterium]